MDLSPSLIWLIIGAAALTAEVMGLSGIGFLFAGIAAFCVGILIELGVAPPGDYMVQTAWWFGLTGLWALLLWKPLRRYMHRNQHYKNVLGDTATVGPAGLKKQVTGQVIWSGTTMNAQIATQCPLPEIAAGVQVKITDMQGTTLFVEPL